MSGQPGVTRPASCARTGWDSNPRGLLTPHDFQSCSLSRSDTRPLTDVPRAGARGWFPGGWTKNAVRAGSRARGLRALGRLYIARSMRPKNRERRGWDSNPRTPFGRDGLANRCRNHLATSPACPNCPSWVRTRTLLIQSQACCQLHQGAGNGGEARAASRCPKRETGLEPATLSLGS